MVPVRRTPVLLVEALLVLGALSASAPAAGADGGEGAGRGVILIHDVHELQNMSLDLNGNYALANDIDASDTGGWAKGLGFGPIGPHFYGELDGRGFTIRGLHIWRPGEDRVGLFRQLMPGAGSVRNLTLAAVNVTGNQWVGGLAGNNSGNIAGCRVTGCVSGVDYVGGVAGASSLGSVAGCSFAGNVSATGLIVGGIVGSNMGAVQDCWSSGKIRGNDTVGGLAGLNWGGRISRSRSDAEVDGRSMVGGFVGHNTGNISRCSSSGNVTGTGMVGGFTGYDDNSAGGFGNIFDSYSTSRVRCHWRTGNPGGFIGEVKIAVPIPPLPVGGRIERCYSAGNVSGFPQPGGFIAYHNGPGVVDCFWDNETTWCNYSANGTGKNTSDMMRKATYANWDFDTVWQIEEGETYPYLRDMPDVQKNRPPVITRIFPTNVTAGVKFILTVEGTDPDGDHVHWNLTTNATWLGYSEQWGIFIGNPAESDAGTYLVTVTATDGRGGSASLTFELTVGEPGRPPEWSQVPGDRLCFAGHDFSWPVRATDPDLLDKVVYGLTSNPPCDMRINASTGDLAWRNAAPGNYTIDLTATDGMYTISHSFNLTVTWETMILSPAGGSEVNGTIEILVLARLCDCLNVTWVYVDGVFLNAGKPVQSPADNYAAYSHPWDTTSAGDGWHTIMVLSPHRDSSENLTCYVNNTGLEGKRPVIVSLSVPENRTVKASSVQTFSVEAVSPLNSTLAYEWRDNGVTVSTERSFARRFAPGNHTMVLLIGDGRYTTTRTFNFTVAPPPRTIEAGPVPVPGVWAGLAAAAIALTAVLGLFWAGGTETGRYRLLSVLFLPLYTRLHGEEVLDNESRGMIRGAIASDPGIHYSEILRRLEMTNGKAAHHLQTLEREGLIWSRSDGRYKRFYPAGMKLSDVPVSLNRLQAAIFETLRERDGQSKSQLSRALEASFPTVHRHVARLAEMGVVRLERRGLSVRCFIADDWKGARRNGRALERAPAAGPDG